MGREKYDKKIEARFLKRGHQLHLTFMGGDEYVEVTKTMTFRNRIAWWADSTGGEITDTIGRNDKIWIKKT